MKPMTPGEEQKTIRAIADKRGLRPRRERWTAADEQYVRSAYSDTETAEMAQRLHRSIGQVYQKAAKLGVEKSEAYLASPAACRLRRGDNVGAATRFQPGQASHNKGLRRPGYSIGRGRMQETQFKKGERSGVAVKLYQPIGAERISKDGYLERKINDDLPLQKRWRAVHLIMWEGANGPLPPSHAIAFKNGDKRDLQLENFELITRAELMRRNTIHNLPPELKRAITAATALNKAIRKKSTSHAEESGRPA